MTSFVSTFRVSQHGASKIVPQFSNPVIGRRAVFINSHALTLEIMDEKRFHKAISGGLKEMRELVGDGLFTAYTGEANWALARQ